MKKLFGVILAFFALGSAAQAVDNFNILDNTQATISGGSISGISPPIPVASGGTGAATLTGIVKGNGTSAMTAVTAPTGALVGTTDTQSLSGKTFDTLSASGTTAGILVNRTSGNTVNSKLQYNGSDYIGYGYDGTDNFLWGYSNNALKVGVNNAERGRFTTSGLTVSGSLNVTADTNSNGQVYVRSNGTAVYQRLDFYNSSGVVEGGLLNWTGNGLYIDNTYGHNIRVNGTTKVAITTTGASVTGTLTVSSGGSADKAICWKSGTTLGYCSSIIGADGSCTCN